MALFSRAFIPPVVRIGAFVGLAAAQAAPALDVRVLPVQAPAPAPVAEWVAPAADGGHWVVVRHRNDITSVDRYGADGSLLTRQFEDEVSEIGGGTWATLQLQGLADGSAVGYNRRCRLVRINADGGLRWVSSEEPREQPCINLQPSASGAFWLSFRDDGGPETGLRRRDASGRDRGRRDQLVDEFVAFSNVVAVSGGESAYVGGQGYQGITPASAVVRVDASGTQEWAWRAANSDNSVVTRIVPRTGGGVLALGRNSAFTLFVAALDAGGRPLYQAAVPGYSGNSIRGVTPTPAGGVLVVTNRQLSTLGPAIVQLDAGGQVTSSVDLAAGETCVRSDRDCALTVYANGEFALLVERGDSTRLKRWSAGGSLLRDVELPFVGIDQEVAAANEGFLVVANQSVYRIGADGQTRALPLAATASAVSPRLLGQYDHGNERLVVLSAGADLTLKLLEPDGTQRWERTLAGAAAPFTDGEFASDAVQFANPYVCLRDPRAASTPPPLRCLALADGSLRLEQRGADNLPPLWGSFGNGTVLWLDRVNGALTLRRWQLQENRELPALLLPPLRSAAGDALKLHRDAFGQPVMAVTGMRADTGLPIAASFGPDDTTTRENSLTRLPDPAALVAGHLLLFQRVNDVGGQIALDLEVLNLSSGARTPARRLAANVRSDWKLLLADADSGHVVGVSGVLVNEGVATRLINLVFPLNELRWQRDLPYAPEQVNQLSTSALLRQGLLSVDRVGALELHAFDLLDGRALTTRTLPCPGDACWSLGATPGYYADTYRTIATVYAPATGRQLMQFSQPLPLTAAIAADQPGVAGTWYHAATRGQGFVLTYVAQSRTLFAPWFTYAVDADRNGESAQRWYSLQGQASPGATTVNLQILRNQGGRFAAPPQTTAEIVGSAELSFTSCDEATLSYRFTAPVENGRSGSQPWTRLGGRLLPCARGDGRTDPPTAPVADAGGFSRRQSGAWFDPVSSGQGLMFEVQPASSGQPGLLFGAWFTYDPQQPGDDPGAQDWLVLQGALGGASAGRTAVPILRITGGALGADATSNLTPIGSAELRFDGCNRLQMDYRFDSTELAAQHSGRVGTLSLERIGGCGPEQ